MTCREKLKIELPRSVGIQYEGGCEGCPHDYGYMPKPNNCEELSCTACWDMEIPERDCKEETVEAVNEFLNNVEKTEGPRILDSGNRRQFESGAVRDICEGKGRCDLLPLDVAKSYLIEENDDCDNVFWVLHLINAFQEFNVVSHLYKALVTFATHMKWDPYTMLLEVSKHFEEGAKKYGDNNWRKGIPVRCYIDSAVRHYLKFLRGDKDEPHDRAFCWNIMCAIWTCNHHPELNEYASKEE